MGKRLDNVSVTITAVTVGNTPVRLAVTRPDRRVLRIQNAGAADLTVSHLASVTAGAGWALFPAAAGFPMLHELAFDDVVPTNEIWAISSGSTSVKIIEG